MKTFYLGAHQPAWMKTCDVPFFVSNRRMRKIKKVKPSQGPWVLDSGGFSELTIHGKWTFTKEEYAQEIKRYQEKAGNLEWAAPMDWMCEPNIIQKTGKSVEEHQQLTIENFLYLRENVGNIVVPVLQGWNQNDYLKHIEMYEKYNVDLTKERITGIGSICRRGQTENIINIVKMLHKEKIKMHTFGMKGSALKIVHHLIESSDSMAWAMRASREEPMPGHPHKRCSSCLEYALIWREKLLEKIHE